MRRSAVPQSNSAKAEYLLAHFPVFTGRRFDLFVCAMGNS
jgi:hypothetical protein